MEKIWYNKTVYITLLFLLFCLSACTSEPTQKSEQNSAPLVGKKILYLDSYHAEYPSNKLARAAFEIGIQGQGIEVRYEYLDSKRIKDSTELIKKAGEFKKIISDWKPDLIIAADDAINKYLISRHYRNSHIPVIFNGVNWSAEAYGYPATNITGQIEVELVEKLFTDLQELSKGSRVGILTGNTLTDRKTLKHYKNILNISFTKEVLVDDFSQWEKQYHALQDSVDFLFIRSVSGIKGWHDSKAFTCIEKHTKIPTATVNSKLEEFVLLSYPKLNQEFGTYSAKTALKILKGTSPKAIPLSTNKKTQLIVNTTLAEKLDLKIPTEMMEIAHLVRIKKRILFVNSYHQGYEWSDGVERGFLRALNLPLNEPFETKYLTPELTVEIIRLDTKRNQDIGFMKERARIAKQRIDQWHPQVVVVSDDNASNYLVAQHYKNSEQPILFCGLNWDASIYGFPTNNITGMVEVAPIKELLTFLGKYSSGKRIGFLAPDVVSERKEIKHYKEVLDIKFTEGIFVTTYDEWKREYLRLQDSVDILIIFTTSQLVNWDKREAIKFVSRHTKIPTGGTTKELRHITLATFSRLSEEQGMWVGTQTLELLKGKKISQIPMTRNKKSTKHLNMRIAKKLDIQFPVEMLEKVILVEEDGEK